MKATTSRQFPCEIEVIAENLYVPWAIVIRDEGKLYFTERSGAIRIIENGKLHPQPLLTFRAPFVSQGKDGSIYLTTSNLDGRGNSDIADDKIIRFILR